MQISQLTLQQIILQLPSQSSFTTPLILWFVYFSTDYVHSLKAFHSVLEMYSWLMKLGMFADDNVDYNYCLSD